MTDLGWGWMTPTLVRVGWYRVSCLRYPLEQAILKVQTDAQVVRIQHAREPGRDESLEVGLFRMIPRLLLRAAQVAEAQTDS